MVIADGGRTMALSNLGWVDRGALWLYDVGRPRAPRHLRLSEAGHLQLHEGDGLTFAVTHHFGGERLVVTVQRFEAPDQPLATVDVQGWEPTVVGDLSAFDPTGRSFVGYLNDDATGAAGYFLIEVTDAGVRVRRLDWFDDTSYDHGYQSVISVLRLPGLGYLFSVQRSSDLVLCDPDTLEVIRTAPLAGRHGNPEPIIHPGSGALLTVDYDTLIRMDATTLTVEATWFGQPSVAGAGMFLGDVWTGDGHGPVLVARPGSGDVVAVDLTTMTPTRSWAVGGQPLEAVKLNDQVIARDWKSGDLLLAPCAAAGESIAG